MYNTTFDVLEFYLKNKLKNDVIETNTYVLKALIWSNKWYESVSNHFFFGQCMQAFKIEQPWAFKVVYIVKLRVYIL